MINEIIQGDCLKVMQSIPDGCVDMILCDLPYGTTACKWDVVIPFAPLWEQYERIIKPNRAIVLTASQPFTSALVMSNPKLFKYCWVWNKEAAANFANANRQPLKVHEDICVFGKGTLNYNPIKTVGPKNHGCKTGNRSQSEFMGKMPQRAAVDTSGLKFPKSIVNFPKYSSQVGLHPTQKPVALFEYLIRTYTNTEQLVLDNTAGSCTTAVAAIHTGRNYICIEREEKYCQVGRQRVEEALARLEALKPVFG